MTAIFDTAKLRHLRARQCLTVRELARRLAVSPTVVVHLEDGTNHDELNGRTWRLLADILGVEVAELLPAPTAKPVAPAEDDVVVEAALACIDHATPDASVARALGWQLSRYIDALRLLEQRLAGTGQRVHDAGWQRHRLRPATACLSERQRTAIHEIAPRERGLTTATARLLVRAARDQLDEGWTRHASAADRAALASLLDQGLVASDQAGRIRVTGRTAYALRPWQWNPDGTPRIDDNEMSAAARAALKALNYRLKYQGLGQPPAED